jgi:hypothetical protein
MRTESLVKIGQDIPKLNSSDSQIAPAQNLVACQGFSRQCNDIRFIQIVSPANSEGARTKFDKLLG